MRAQNGCRCTLSRTPVGGALRGSAKPHTGRRIVVLFFSSTVIGSALLLYGYEMPEPMAVTLLRSSVLVMTADAVGAAQVNEVPSGQTAWNCTRAVGSGPSVSGAS
jgi:hypothetical protein